MGMVLVSALIQLVLLVLGLRYLFAWRKRPPVVSGLSYRWAQADLYGLGALASAGFVDGSLGASLYRLAPVGLADPPVGRRAGDRLVAAATRDRPGPAEHPDWQFGSLHPSNVFRWVGALSIAGAPPRAPQVARKVLAAADVASNGQPDCLLAAGPGRASTGTQSL